MDYGDSGVNQGLRTKSSASAIASAGPGFWLGGGVVERVAPDPAETEFNFHGDAGSRVMVAVRPSEITLTECLKNRIVYRR